MKRPRITSAVQDALSGRLLCRQGAHDRDDDEEHCQTDRELEQRPLHSAATMVDRAIGRERRGKTRAARLKQDNADEHERYENLNEMKIRGHSSVLILVEEV
jgi:hypothetical protein